MQNETIRGTLAAALDLAASAQRLSAALRRHEHGIGHDRAAALRQIGMRLADFGTALIMSEASLTPSVKAAIEVR